MRLLIFILFASLGFSQSVLGPGVQVPFDGTNLYFSFSRIGNVFGITSKKVLLDPTVKVVDNTDGTVTVYGTGTTSPSGSISNVWLEAFPVNNQITGVESTWCLYGAENATLLMSFQHIVIGGSASIDRTTFFTNGVLTGRNQINYGAVPTNNIVSGPKATYIASAPYCNNSPSLTFDVNPNSEEWLTTSVFISVANNK